MVLLLRYRHGREALRSSSYLGDLLFSFLEKEAKTQGNIRAGGKDLYVLYPRSSAKESESKVWRK